MSTDITYIEKCFEKQNELLKEINDNLLEMIRLLNRLYRVVK